MEEEVGRPALPEQPHHQELELVEGQIAILETRMENVKVKVIICSWAIVVFVWVLMYNVTVGRLLHCYAVLGHTPARCGSIPSHT